jgi:hypothetical protein
MLGGTGEEAQTNTTRDRLGDLLWKAIPAIGSAIGFAGFVTIIGAALLWLRFDRAHLPATQALLAVPRQELVITGGWALGLAVLGGLAASLLVYMFDSRGDANPRTARGIALVATLELFTTAFLRKLSTLDAALYVLWAAAVGAVLAYSMSVFARNLPARRRLKQLRREAIRARTRSAKAECALKAIEEVQVKLAGEEAKTLSDPLAKARVEQAAARSEWIRAVNEWTATRDDLTHPPNGQEADPPKATPAVETDPTEAAPAPAPTCAVVKQNADLPSEFELRRLLTSSKERLWSELDPRLQVIYVLILVAALAGLLFIVINTEADLCLAALFIVAVALALTDLFIAHGTEKFLWYGVSVFFSVVVFGAVFKAVYTVRFPSVQPMALLRKDNSGGLCGVFVAQTSERVYVGRLPYGSRPGLIFWVPTSEIDSIAVGQLKPIDNELRTRASAMLARLYADRAEEAPIALKNTTTTVVKKPGNRGSRQETVITETSPHRTKSRLRPHMSVSSVCPPRPVNKRSRLPLH